MGRREAGGPFALLLPLALARRTGTRHPTMTTELTLLALSILLGFVHIFAAGGAKNLRYGLRWAAGPRDAQKPAAEGAAGRLVRAQNNFFETFAFFAAAVLIAHVANRHNGFTVAGAYLYFIARVIYLPVYWSGVPWIRSGIWFAAVIGVLLILLGLVWP